MDNKSKSLIKSTIIYSIGNFGSKVLSFGLIPLYSYYLTKEEFGYYDLVVSTIVLLVPLITLQLSDSIFRWLLDNKDDIKIQKTIATSAFTFVLFNSLLAFLILIGVSFFADIEFLLTILVLLITTIFYGMIQQFTRGLSYSKFYAISGVMLTFSLLTCNLLFLFFFKLKIEALFISSILSNIISISFLAYKTNFFKFLNFDYLKLKTLKEMLYYSLPLVPNTLSWWLIMSANKYIIVLNLGEESLGLFSLANRFPALLVMVSSIFLLAWQESAITVFNDQDKDKFFSKIFNKLFRAQFSLVILLILTSEFLVKYIISSSFYESWKYLPLLYLGAVFSSFSAFYGSIYIGAKDTKGALYTSVIGGITNVVLSFVFVRYIGLFGVCVANCLSFVVLFVLRFFNTKKYANINLHISKVLTAVFSVLFSLAVVYINKLQLSITIIIVTSILIFYINRKDLLTLLKQIKR